jgi:hypothetical protein
MLVNMGKAPAKSRCKNKNAAANKPSSSTEPKAKVQKRNPKIVKNKDKPNSRPITSCANEAEDNDICGNCGFAYGDPNDPLIEDEWLKCIRCSKWCHFSCGTARKMTFECFTCV